VEYSSWLFYLGLAKGCKWNYKSSLKMTHQVDLVWSERPQKEFKGLNPEDKSI
jgi:hypothetical protein